MHSQADIDTGSRVVQTTLDASAGTSVQRIGAYRIVYLHDGSGEYEVDFNRYAFLRPRILFLNPGQYLRAVSGRVDIAEIRLPEASAEDSFDPTGSGRVLFTHVYEAGAIHAPAQDGIGLMRKAAGSPDGLSGLVEQAAQNWLEQNPLGPKLSSSETDLIIELRRAVESHYTERLNVDEYARLVGYSTKWINRTMKSSVDRTIGDLVGERRLLEARRKLVFSDDSVSGIAHKTGFSDAAYFSRRFSDMTGESPTTFRERYRVFRPDPFLDDVYRFIEEHFREHRSVQFYAELLHMSPGALSERVARLTGRPLSLLVRERVIREARRMLAAGAYVHETADLLGFADAFHFSHYFKAATGTAPVRFRDLDSA